MLLVARGPSQAIWRPLETPESHGAVGIVCGSPSVGQPRALVGQFVDLRQSGRGQVGEACGHVQVTHTTAPEHWSCRSPKPNSCTGARQTRARLFCLIGDGWQGLSLPEKPIQACPSSQAGLFASLQLKSKQATSKEYRVHFAFSSKHYFP